jgi:GMP synthase-like glutamine amidotransferase
MNVCIIDGSGAYERLFLSLGYHVTRDINEAGLVCFTGGEDVTPAIYGDKAHPSTFFSVYRDAKETNIFNQCIDNGVPMVGICRGAQFLNVMSGGRMYQDVSEHTRSHALTDVLTGETVYVSSTHHQMMMPSDKALLVASSCLGGTREWYDGEVFKKDTSKEDIEVVYYEHTKALCFQPHPEFTSAEYFGMKVYFQALLKRHLGV